MEKIEPRRRAAWLTVILAVGAGGCQREAPPAQQAPVQQPQAQAQGQAMPGMPPDMNVRMVPLAQAGQALAQIQQEMRGQAAGAVGAPGLPSGLAPPAGLPGKAAQAPGEDKLPTPDELGKVVQHLYSLAYDAEFDVLRTEREAFLVKIILQPRTGGAPQAVYVTPDGLRLVEEAIDLPRRIRQFEDDRRFATCLVEKRVRVYVRKDHETTPAQMAELGRFAPRVAIDCAASTENCARAGITEFPTTVLGDRIETGVKARGWFETLAGCK